MDRRDFLKTTAALATVSAAGSAISAQAQGVMDKDSDAYWETIRAEYKVTDEFNNLNAGHWGIMSEPVREAFAKHTEFINAYSSHFMGSGRRVDPNARSYNVERAEIIDMLAEKLGVNSDELVFTRGVTESLQLLISGYNKLEPGDTVLFADAAYYSMQAEMRHMTVHRGAKVVLLDIPYPVTWENQIDVFEQGIKDNPGTKLILVTHMANRTGVIVPVKEIQAMARGYGVDVIVDAAHSWGQYDMDFADLNLDFVGFNLHKWIGAPLGVGLMYIRKSRMLDIDTKSSKGPAGNDDINNRVQTGTMNLAAVLSVRDALLFLADIGIVHIDRRFKALRHEWVKEFLDDDRVDILTPEDDRMHAGLTSFRIKAHPNAVELGNTLLRDYGINSAPIGNMNAIRISPGLYSSKADMAALAVAIKEIADKL
ncbi:MAG: aminotransferase class V-fold PLP-dependent enzyme [Kordiimonadaceae bacterium]|jgi:isopenicillin-N epimerase|nr:aminotransferase class V-fold PLP-dependent enzyme [Kordiimonadaceae bacterium]MBT6036603.1 aminotransferase class V-fold PLP-dependent enzyme [Kordiimonadaceae bacterium]MBT6330882.1 aminotransferase class V-fold PLP-dependent enzyme [Kordiimonadaceae bacterium]MBT7581339.1 aminotransferase class V-fold PLP-dependent enzyme [Kordiimonadaceae bacterium]